MEEKNKNKGLIGIIVILIILLFGLGAFIVYDKILNDNKISYKSIKPIDESEWKEISLGSANGKTKYAVIFRGIKDEKLNYEHNGPHPNSQYIEIIDDDYIGYDEASREYTLDELKYDILYTFKCDGDCDGGGYGNYVRVHSNGKYYLINVSTKKGIEISRDFKFLQYNNKLYSIVYEDANTTTFDDLNGNVIEVETINKTVPFKTLDTYDPYGCSMDSYIYKMGSNCSYMYSLGHIPIGNKIINFRTKETIKTFEGYNISCRDLSNYDNDLKGYEMAIYEEPHGWKYERIFINENYEEMVRVSDYYSDVFNKNVIFLKDEDDNHFYKYDLENNKLSKSNKYNQVYKNGMSGYSEWYSMNSAYFLVNDNNELKIIDDKENVVTKINNDLKPEDISGTALWNWRGDNKLIIDTNNDYKSSSVFECNCEWMYYYEYDLKEKNMSEKKVCHSCSN